MTVKKLITPVMPLLDRVGKTLRKHSGKIVSGVGALLITPLVARVVSDASGWVVDRVWGSGDAPADEPSPGREEYEEWTKKELYRLAQDLDIRGRSKMRKAELIEAIRAYQHENT